MARVALALLLMVGCSGSADDPAPGAVADTGTLSDTGTADTGATEDAATDSAPTTANVPGKRVVKEMLEGIEREFIVYTPEKARGDKRVPVVFMLHGTSGDGEKFYDISGWRQKADAEGFIAVFPSALTYCLKEDENKDGDFDDPGERAVTTKWASGNLGDPTRMPLCTAAELAMLSPENRALADHPIKDDVAFFKRMLDFLGTNYATDAKRVYVSGFSNGAQMSSRLSVELADRFAAAAAHAGPMASEPTPPARPITVVFSVGNVDDRFTTTPIPIAESTASTPMFQRINGDYLTAGKLENKYVFDQPKPTIARWTYKTSTAGGSNQFIAVLIEKCGHVYPNGTNHPMVMADALWELFKTQSLP